MNSRFILPALALGMGLIAGTSAVANADQAIVIGVNKYPKLTKGSDLEGCENDARSVIALLGHYGFAKENITVLLNSEATMANIKSKVAEIKAKNKSTERFVFYFAGHGTHLSDGNSGLLPSDAEEGNERSSIDRKTLYDMINSVPARSHTVLLDSCFAGGLTTRGIKGRKVMKTRFHNLRGANGKKLHQEANDTDNNDHINNGSNICYFVASLESQASGEDDFEQKRDGVFTHFLVQRLMDTSKGKRWGDIQKDVTGAVEEYMDHEQTPKLDPVQFSNAEVFNTPDGPKPKPDPSPNRTAWDDYNEDHTDKTQIQILMEPNRNTVKVKDKFSFNLKIGTDGYLVLLERDVDDKVYILYPSSLSVEDAFVKGGTTKSLPRYYADTPGNEKVKAILFTSRDEAAALLKSLPKEMAPDGAGVSSRDLRNLARPRKIRREDTFFTSVLSIGVE